MSDQLGRPRVVVNALEKRRRAQSLKKRDQLLLQRERASLADMPSKRHPTQLTVTDLVGQKGSHRLENLGRSRVFECLEQQAGVQCLSNAAKTKHVQEKPAVVLLVFDLCAPAFEFVVGGRMRPAVGSSDVQTKVGVALFVDRRLQQALDDGGRSIEALQSASPKCIATARHSLGCITPGPSLRHGVSKAGRVDHFNSAPLAFALAFLNSSSQQGCCGPTISQQQPIASSCMGSGQIGSAV